MDYYDFVASAIAAVASLYNANAELAHLQKIGVKDVCVLWCGSTLQNNKAWLSTTVPDCMYYEATYDGDKKELRLDERFIARRRARFDGIDGKVNIPYGTALTCQDGFLMHKNQRVCAVGSQNGMDCFVQDDDGNGTLRGDLVGNIQRSLERRDADYQTRWNRVWASALCQKYRRPESEDYWLWARAFFDAPIFDLQAIAALVQ